MSASALLVKVNWVGTASESFDAAGLGHRAGLAHVIGRRSA
jgi:enolase